MPLPVVAIVGRPNVGKSSLLNCIARKLISIVEPTPGVTRDRVTTICHVGDVWFELVDTGGYGVDDVDNLTADIERQIALAIEQAALILFMVDVRDGIVPLDTRVAKLLRAHHDRVIVVANKVDQPAREAQAAEFERLGFGEPMLMSALLGYGRGELVEKIVERIGPLTEAVPTDPVMHVAVVGRQNTGKSTFINSLAGEERMIVSEIPGTTRDAVDLRFEKDGRTFVAIDTAGVKKRSQLGGSIDFYGFNRVQQSIKRADVCVLFIDALAKVTTIDKKVGRLIADEHKPCVLVVNKWDLAADRAATDDYSEYLTKTLNFLDFAPIVFTTAKDARNTDAVIDTAWSLFQQARTRVSTSELNRALEEALAGRGPSAKKGRKHPRVYYGTQIAATPPTLVLFVNDPAIIKEEYKRYLITRLQQYLPYAEVPIRVMFRPRRGREAAAGMAND
jgi:GTP-binding protein